MTALVSGSSISRLPSFARLFHTSCSSYGQARVMKKLLKGSSKKKCVFSEFPTLPTPEEFSKGVYEGKKSDNSRRAAVLNKLFMRHITDLMATGENAGIYAGLGIEINRVRVTPDYKLVQVYWVAKGNDKDETIHKLLTKNAGQLRHELCQLRVMGAVPKLLFCKDKTLAILNEIDRKLETADFGEDHVPVDVVSKLKEELELNISLPPKIKEKIGKVDAENSEDTQEPAIPAMPQNIFGLDHAYIMSRVINSVRKAQAAHRKVDTVETPLPQHSLNTDPIHFEDGMSQKEALKKFLLQRRLQISKAKKGNKNYSPDVEYMKNELEERGTNLGEFFEEREEEDYTEDYDERSSSDWKARS